MNLFLELVAKGVLFGVFSNLIGFFKQQKVTKYEKRALLLRIPQGILASFMIYYFGITGVEALVTGIALSDMNESMTKLFSRRFLGKPMESVQRGFDPQVFKDMIICSGDIEPGYSAERGIEAIHTVMSRYLNPLCGMDSVILEHVEEAKRLTRSHCELDIDMCPSSRKRLNNLVRVWLQYMTVDDEKSKSGLIELSGVILADVRKLCGLEPVRY